MLLQDSRSQEQPLAACLGAYAGVGMAGAASGADSACRFCLAVERNGDRFNSTGEGFPSYLLIGGPLELVVLLGEANLLHHVPAATGGGGNNRVRERGEEPGIAGRAEKSIRADRVCPAKRESPLALGPVEDEVGGAVGAPADLLHHLVLLHPLPPSLPVYGRRRILVPLSSHLRGGGAAVPGCCRCDLRASRADGRGGCASEWCA